MSTTYAQRQSPAQKKDAPTASSVLDNSAQGESIQRKDELTSTSSVLQLLTAQQQYSLTNYNPTFSLHNAFVSKHLPTDEQMSKSERSARALNRFKDKKDLRFSSVIVDEKDNGQNTRINRERISANALKKLIENDAQQKISTGNNGIRVYNSNNEINVGIPMSNFKIRTTSIKRGQIIGEKTSESLFYICGPWTNNEISGYHFEIGEPDQTDNINPLSEIYPKRA